MYPNFQAKGPLPDRTLESFIQKHQRDNSYSLRKSLQNLSKELFLNISRLNDQIGLVKKLNLKNLKLKNQFHMNFEYSINYWRKLK